jgi:hypothetical protein
MKNRLITFFSFLTAIGLFLLAAAETAPVQAQPTPNDLVTVPTTAPAVPSQPAAGFVLKPVGIVKEVEKLTQSGTDPAVVKAFIQSWRTPYAVNADDILRLHGVGVPSEILTTLIQHEADIVGQVSAAANPNPVAAPPNAPVQYPASAAPPIPDQYAPQGTYPVDASVYSYPAYPVYDCGYYGYPGPYFYPGVSVGVGFGFRSHGGFHGGYGGHGGSFAGRPGSSFGGHAGGNGGHGGGFGGQGGGVGGHGSGFGGHGGSSGGRSGGGHR